MDDATNVVTMVDECFLIWSPYQHNIKFLLISFDDITKTKRYSTRVDRIDDTDRLVFALQFALAMFDDITTVTWHSG